MQLVDRWVILLEISAVVWAAGSSVLAADEQPSWQIPTDAAVRRNLDQWLQQRQASPQVMHKVNALWSLPAQSENGRGNLHCVSEVIGLGDERAETLVAACQRGAIPETIALSHWLDGDQVAPLVRNNLRLLLGRSLAQGRYFDEAQQQFEGLETTDVLDPATLLFYQAIIDHHAVEKEKGCHTINRLLERGDEIPVRYRVLGRLMRSDLMQLKSGSLDDISRRMKDIERRLHFGRAGERVQETEDEVIRMLDKLIEEEEKKQSQQSQSLAGGGQPSRPAQDSIPAGGKGPGEVQKRDLGSSSRWGDLPPKEREEAMQEIGRDFPAHYREVIEEYFRELAREQN